MNRTPPVLSSPEAIRLTSNPVGPDAGPASPMADAPIGPFSRIIQNIRERRFETFKTKEAFRREVARAALRYADVHVATFQISSEGEVSQIVLDPIPQPEGISEEVIDRRTAASGIKIKAINDQAQREQKGKTHYEQHAIRTKVTRGWVDSKIRDLDDLRFRGLIDRATYDDQVAEYERMYKARHYTFRLLEPDEHPHMPHSHYPSADTKKASYLTGRLENAGDPRKITEQELRLAEQKESAQKRYKRVRKWVRRKIGQ